ncbi:MAG: tryptophan synthase subunit alpha, partial [Acidobacteriota bacterium]|nr:tryptophan synthase subunit alpha [Acidobacteriota bacterium]
AGGTHLDGVLDMVASVRPRLRVPVVLFSYANPMFRMGLTRFADRAAAAGVDGVLTLDVPPEEADEVRGALAARGVDTIFLLSPTTSTARIQRAAELGSGFLYGISRLGVTGARDEVADSAQELAERVRQVTTRPLALGFGISRPEHVRAIGRWADAAVVGSALVSVIARHGGSPQLLDEVERYVRWLTAP